MVKTFAESFERFVKARLGPGSRCLVVGEKGSLEGAHQGSTIQYVADPEEAPSGFLATHVCVPGLQNEAQLKSWLSFLKGQSQGAELILSMNNGSSASQLLLRCLEQEHALESLNATQVQRLLGNEGFKVQEEAWWRGEPQLKGLALATAQAMRSVFAELQPRALADQIFLVAVPTSKPVVSLPWEEGKLSVVITAQLPAQAVDLEETLFALVGQEHQSIEVCVVCEGVPAQEEAKRLCQRYGRFLRFPSRVVSRASLVQEGLRGQYVAFLSAGTVVYPRHFVRLIESLQVTGAAWSLARGRQRKMADGLGEDFVETKIPYPAEEGFDFRVLQEEGALLPGAVMDRARMGSFLLEPPADAAGSTGAALLLRIGSLFAPCFLPQLTSFELIRTCESVPRVDGVALLAWGDLDLIATRIEQSCRENFSLKKRLLRQGKECFKAHAPRAYAQLKRWVFPWVSR